MLVGSAFPFLIKPSDEVGLETVSVDLYRAEDPEPRPLLDRDLHVFDNGGLTSLDPSAAAPGTVGLQLFIRDRTGASRYHHVRYRWEGPPASDNSAPRVVWRVPDAGSILSGNEATFRVGVADETALGRVSIDLYQNEPKVLLDRFIATDLSTGFFEARLNYAAANPGRLTVQVFAEDTLGNSGFNSVSYELRR